jgi:hypothetical protein
VYIDIPGFEKRSVREITEKVGNLSGAVAIHSIAYDSATENPLWLGQEVIGERLVRHTLHFALFQTMCEDDVNFRVNFTQLEDIFAIEAVFAEMTRLIPLIESGAVTSESGYVEIHKPGAVFSFTMDLWTDWALGYVPDAEAEFKSAGCGGYPNTCSFRVNVITPNGDVEVGCYELNDEISTAIRIAHDFEVMRALIDGKPEAEILALKPIRIPLPKGSNPVADMLIAQLEGVVDNHTDSEVPTAEKPVLH